jgi:hypothetical protein
LFDFRGWAAGPDLALPEPRHGDGPASNPARIKGLTCNTPLALACHNPTKVFAREWGRVMVGTVVLVILITLTALGVVLYAAYCEAGEDLPCKKSRRQHESSAAKVTQAGRPGSGS